MWPPLPGAQSFFRRLALTSHTRGERAKVKGHTTQIHAHSVTTHQYSFEIMASNPQQQSAMGRLAVLAKQVGAPGAGAHKARSQ